AGDPARLQFADDPPPEGVVPDDAAQRHPEAEPSRPARDDPPGPSDRDVCSIHQPLGLPEHGLDVPAQDDVRIDVTEHEQIEPPRHTATIPSASQASMRPALSRKWWQHGSPRVGAPAQYGR